MSELQQSKATADFMHQLTDAMGNTASNISEMRSGCFEFCDGFPEAILTEHRALLRSAADETTPAEAVLERASRLGKIQNRIDSIRENTCPGAYGLFYDDDELYDDLTGEPLQRQCYPGVKAALQEVAVEFGLED